jgi:transcriptional regulator with XRE-family HTH domain
MGDSGVWPTLIERLKMKLGAPSYAHLARQLGVSPQKLADARKGRRELPSDAKAEILGLLGEPVSQEIYESVFPASIRQEVSSHLENVYEPADEGTVSDGFWIRRLDQLKSILSDEDSDEVPDSIIAASLGISQSMISAARRGKGTLSPAAKFKLLDRLSYMAGKDILCDLLPAKAADRIKKFETLRFIERGERRKRRRSGS